jgi:hypothetical protein
LSPTARDLCACSKANSAIVESEHAFAAAGIDGRHWARDERQHTPRLCCAADLDSRPNRYEKKNVEDNFSRFRSQRIFRRLEELQLRAFGRVVSRLHPGEQRPL